MPILPTRPINPQQEVGRHYLQSASEPIPSTPPPRLKLHTLAAEDRVGMRRSWHRKKNKINPICQCMYMFSRRGLFIQSPSFPRSSLSFSLSLCLAASFSEMEEKRGEERGSLSLRPECLAVFKWRTRTCFCPPRQIHCGGRWAKHTYTHPQSGHRLVCPCLCLYAGWQPSRQLRSQWAQRITMATNIVGQAVAALGSVRRLFLASTQRWSRL